MYIKRYFVYIRKKLKQKKRRYNIKGKTSNYEKGKSQQKVNLKYLRSSKAVIKNKFIDSDKKGRRKHEIKHSRVKRIQNYGKHTNIKKINEKKKHFAKRKSAKFVNIPDDKNRNKRPRSVVINKKENLSRPKIKKSNTSTSLNIQNQIRSLTLVKKTNRGKNKLKKSNSRNLFVPKFSKKFSLSKSKNKKKTREILIGQNHQIKKSKSQNKFKIPSSKKIMKSHQMIKKDGQKNKPWNSTFKDRVNVLLKNITAESFLVHESTSNRILISRNPRLRREMASLTKIMTCYALLKFCEEHSIDISANYFQVSRAAVEVIGTSAKLQSNTFLTIRDLLFGLMLPSGNDAALCIAENVGRLIRLKNDANDLDLDIHSGFYYSEPDHLRFIYLMNQHAEKLGLNDTRFANPHGLNNIYNTSTSQDLLLLSLEAMKMEVFRDVVKTLEHRAKFFKKKKVLKKEKQSEKKNSQFNLSSFKNSKRNVGTSNKTIDFKSKLIKNPSKKSIANNPANVANEENKIPFTNNYEEKLKNQHNKNDIKSVKLNNIIDIQKNEEKNKKDFSLKGKSNKGQHFRRLLTKQQNTSPHVQKKNIDNLTSLKDLNHQENKKHEYNQKLSRSITSKNNKNGPNETISRNSLANSFKTTSRNASRYESTPQKIKSVTKGSLIKRKVFDMNLYESESSEEEFCYDRPLNEKKRANKMRKQKSLNFSKFQNSYRAKYSKNSTLLLINCTLV